MNRCLACGDPTPLVMHLDCYRAILRRACQNEIAAAMPRDKEASDEMPRVPPARV